MNEVVETSGFGGFFDYMKAQSVRGTAPNRSAPSTSEDGRGAYRPEDAARSVVSVDRLGRKRRHTHRDVAGAAGTRCGVPHPRTGRCSSGLSGGDPDRSVLGVDVDLPLEDDGVLVELGPLTRLRPPRRAFHDGDRHRRRPRGQSPHELEIVFGGVPAAWRTVGCDISSIMAAVLLVPHEVAGHRTEVTDARRPPSAAINPRRWRPGRRAGRRGAPARMPPRGPAVPR